MSKPTAYTDSSWKIRPTSSLSKLTGGTQGESRGEIQTPHGIVSAYRYEDYDRPKDEFVILDFIHAGILYRRRFDGKSYADRALVTLGNRFAREKVEAAGDGWTPVSSGKLPRSMQRVLCKYEGVYDCRVVTFWKDAVNTHFGLPSEPDGKGSQPATHWRAIPA